MTVHIIGVNHAPGGKHLELARRLLDMCSREEIVFGYEGHPRDPAYEQFHMNQHGYDGGLFFGLENELAMKLGQYIGSYWKFGTPLDDGLINDRRMVSGFQVVGDLSISDLVRTIWSSMGTKLVTPGVSGLMDRIERFVFTFGALPMQQQGQVFREAYGIVPEMKKPENWMQLFRLLGKEALERARRIPGQQDLPYEEFGDFLSSDPNENGETVILAQANWRNQFMIGNMDEPICISESRGIDGYFVFGAKHTDVIAERVSSNNTGLDLVYAKSEVDIPKEYESFLS